MNFNLDREKYSERELAQLLENVEQAERDVRVAEAALRAAQQEHTDRSREYRRAVETTDVLKKIESYGLNHRVVILAERTYVRVSGVESLYNRNAQTRRVFFKLARFVQSGELPKWYNDNVTTLDYENSIMQWCDSLLSNDMTQVGHSLKAAVRTLFSEIRERWMTAA